MTEITYRPIGVIHSPHTDPKATPVQPVFAEGIEGTAEVFPEFADGLKDVEGFSHLFIIFHFHRAGEPKLQVKPYLQDEVRGVFACRAPCRPNGIGFSVCRLVKREGALLHLADLDILDGTPLLDIKPYIARFDSRTGTRDGWQKDVDDEAAAERGVREYRGNSDA
jgi:tRNA (adenine37-N6)-methyltransferase